MEDGEGNRMAHTITLEVPQDVYNSLLAAAKEAGESPEEVALHYIVEAIQPLTHDPLDDIIGAISSDIPDWGERHDYYIGQTIMESMRPTASKDNSEVV